MRFRTQLTSTMGAGLLLAFTLIASQANATWCRRASACESYASASAVFLGEATTGESLPDGSTRTRFLVKEAFKGVSEREVIVVSQPVLGLPAVHFRPGEEYLVFAGTDATRQLVVSNCGQTLPSSLAVGDLRFLRTQGMPNAPKTLLYGSVYQWNGDEHVTNLRDTEIQASGSPGSFQTITDSDGYFEFRNLPPGSYKVEPVLPDTLARFPEEVKLEAGGCKAASLMTQWNGRISGRATLWNGTAIADANINLMDQARDRGEGAVGRTDEQGNYKFESLQPGRYVVGLLDLDGPSDDFPFPPLFYPNATEPSLADVLELGEGQKLDHVDFIVRNFDPHTLRVQVLWPGSRPASGSHVFIEYEESYCWKHGCVLPYFTAHEDGRVLFYGYGDGEIRVYATAKNASGQEEISEFKELNLSHLPFATTLTVSLPNCYNATGQQESRCVSKPK
jgi:hypothetical protein